MSELKFTGRNWDARNWTREQKIQWQEKTFELGYSWDGEGVHYLDSPYYTTNKDGSLYRSDVSYHFSESSGELLTFGDMFPEEQEDEKLDVIKEITELFSESIEEDVSDEDECSFDGLVYVQPDLSNTWIYYRIEKDTCSEEQWQYLVDTLPPSTNITGKESSLQNCGDGWFDNNDELQPEDIVTPFNDLFQYEDELCSVQ